MKLEDVEVGKKYQWNGKIFAEGEEQVEDAEEPQVVTVERIDPPDGNPNNDMIPIYGDCGWYLRPEDLSPLAEEAECK